MNLLRQDLRQAARRLATSPLFTLVAVLSLALGIGANTAIFSLVNAVLLRELPVAAPEQLVEVYTSEENGFAYSTTSYPDYLDLRQATDVFRDVLAYELFITPAEAGTAGGSPLVMGEMVTGNYFDMLGVTAALGRTFAPEEGATPNTHAVVVLGHGYWQRVFGGEPSVLGRTVRLNRRPFTVIGVAPAAFKGMFPGLEADMYVPLMMVHQLMPSAADRLGNRGNRGLFLKGRLREGVSTQRADAALAVIGQRLQDAYPESNRDRRMSVVPSSKVALHPLIDRALVPVAALLLAVVGLVLLVACTNLASFLLARATDRRREIVVRLALGARRSQLVRQLLVESLLLALLGGAAGVFLAQAALRVLVSFQPPLPFPIRLDLAIDGRVLWFTLAVTVVAGIAFGLVPGLHATRPNLSSMLREDAGSVVGGRRRATLRGVLVSAQVAVSLLLLMGAGLFLRSLSKAQRMDPGFDTSPAAILWPWLEIGGFDEARGRVLQSGLRDALRALPGVTAVGMADRLPLGAAIQTRGIVVAGVEPPAGQRTHELDFVNATASYFETLNVPILAGRNFQPADARSEGRVAIVSEAAARRFWPDRDAVGQLFWLDEARAQPVRVVGIARDTKVRTLGEAPRPYFYLNAEQTYIPSLMFIVRGAGPVRQLVNTVRQTALDLDPNLVILEAKTMDDHLALLLFPPRMAAVLLSVFGGLALLLAAIGLYGTVSYAVSRRTREVGVRTALGASRREVVLLLTGSGMRLIAVGAIIGLLLAAGLTWLLSSFLYGIRPTDALTFLGVPLLLAAVGLLACWVPARRAARIDPMIALRAE
jgi:predicted permease